MPHEIRDDCELGILDFLILLLNNWRWFLAAPIVVGVLTAACLHFFSSPVYVSEAVIRITASDVSRFRSENVIKTAIINSGFRDQFDSSIEYAIDQIINRDLKVMSVGRASNIGRSLYRVSLTYKTPEGSQALLESIIQSFLNDSIPKGDKREAIQSRINELKIAIADIGAVYVLPEQHPDTVDEEAESSKRSETDVNFYLKTISASLARRYDELTHLYEDLSGSVSAADVVQEVTLATGARSLSNAILIITAMAMATMATALTLLIRQSFRKALNDEQQLTKINKIRHALGLKAIIREG